MVTETRILIVLCSAASVLLAARPTQADTRAPLGIVERADTALARALPIVFKSGTVETRSLPAFAGARHAITLGETQIPITPKLTIRAGAGLAAIEDAPRGSNLAHTGCAFSGTASYVLVEPVGLRIGVELTTLHVSYGATGFTDETMMLAVTTR
jgi:hypothetical protein